MGFHGNLISSMVTLCFDLVNTLKASAEVVTTCIGIPGLMLR